ncbi:hypothetical protein BDW71DRAFT_211184 [Aspergillus fruticulosus]
MDSYSVTICISDDVRARMVKYALNEDAVLSGFVVGNDGKLHYAELPLGDHYENDDGYFKQKKNGHFQYTAKSFWLESGFELSAELKYWSLGGGYQIAGYPIYKDIRVGDDGSLSIDDPVEYGFFDLRGPFFEFLEKIPILGYWVAGIDAIAGDEDEALKAVAECTYSTVVLAATLAGSFLGGPLGAAVGSAVAAAAAPFMEAAIAQGISDPTMRSELTAVSIYKILTQEVFIIAGVGIGEISGAFGKLLTDELTEEGFESLFSDMGGQLGKKGLKALTKKQMKMIVNTLVDAVQHGQGEEYVRAKIQQYERPLLDLKKIIKQAEQKAIQKAKQNVKEMMMTFAALPGRPQALSTALQDVVRVALESIHNGEVTRAENDPPDCQPEGQEDSPAVKEIKGVINNATEKISQAAERVIQNAYEAIKTATATATSKIIPTAVDAAMKELQKTSDQAMADAVQKMGEESRKDVQKTSQELLNAACDSVQKAAYEAQQEAQYAIQKEAQKYVIGLEKILVDAMVVVLHEAIKVANTPEPWIKTQISEANPAKCFTQPIQDLVDKILDTLREKAQDEGQAEWEDRPGGPGRGMLSSPPLDRDEAKKEAIGDFRSRAEKAVQDAEQTVKQTLAHLHQEALNAVERCMQGVKEAAEQAVADTSHTRGDAVQMVQEVVQKTQEIAKVIIQKAAEAVVQKEAQDMKKAAMSAIQEGEQKLQNLDMDQEVLLGEIEGDVGMSGWKGAPLDPAQELLQGRMREHEYEALLRQKGKNVFNK